MGSIIWIASYPKSGNTWTRLFFGALIAGRTSMDAIDSLGNLTPYENGGQFYRPFLGKPISEASLGDFARVRPEVHRAIARAVEGYVLLKTHMPLGYHLGTPTITGDVTSAAIYIVRNPLDVVVSYAAYRNWSIDEAIDVLNSPGRVLTRSPHHSYMLTGSWLESVESWTRRAREGLCILKYEDLLARPIAEFTRAVRALHMKASAAAIATAVDLVSFDSLARAEARSGFVETPDGTERFFRAGRRDDWRSCLSEAQIAAIVGPNQHAMKRLGYWEAEFDTLVAHPHP